MRNTLYWKKTIGILSIILGGLRFTNGINTYVNISTIEKQLNNSLYSDVYPGITQYVSLCRDLLPFELIAVASILVLGIVLLCTEKGIPTNMPREKSRKICYGILGVSLFHLYMEWYIYKHTPDIIIDNISLITVFASLCWVIVLITFCILGLKNIGYSPKYFVSNTPMIYIEEIATLIPSKEATNQDKIEQDPIDQEIADLKKQIEKRKLEKELEQINSEKQAEIEQLKKELNELE